MAVSWGLGDLEKGDKKIVEEKYSPLSQLTGSLGL